MKYVTSEAVSSEGSVANKGNIDWNDFNYPCLIKIYHYDPKETPEVHRRRVVHCLAARRRQNSSR